MVQLRLKALERAMTTPIGTRDRSDAVEAEQKMRGHSRKASDDDAASAAGSYAD